MARNPKQPDWGGLDMMTSSAISGRGAAEVPIFLEWIANTQKSQAQIMKQTMMLRGERVAEARNKKKGGEGDKGGDKG